MTKHKFACTARPCNSAIIVGVKTSKFGRKVLSPHLNDKCCLTEKQLAIGKFYNAANKIYREDPEKKTLQSF